MAKTCKREGCSRGTYGEFCLMHKPRKPLKQRGKQYINWQTFRKEWLKVHKEEWFTCGICGEPVHRDLVTLDHILPRSGNPELRFNEDNIQPSHLTCNLEKGSKRI